MSVDDPIAETDNNSCPVIMSDEKACGRPIYDASRKPEERPACVMHSAHPDKAQEFMEEVQRILSGTSSTHRPADRYDLARFVFPAVDFSRMKFGKDIYLIRATFLADANFSEAEFVGSALFTGARFAAKVFFTNAIFDGEANLSSVTFAGLAHFGGTTFRGTPYFSEALFQGAAFFLGTQFGPPLEESGPLLPVDLVGTKFDKPAEVLFSGVNMRARHGFLPRLIHCDVEQVRFEGVNFYKEKGRFILQDERDVRATPAAAYTCEFIAIAYRRLVSNFERTRNYDLAEECAIGAMEMKRLDPQRFVVAQRMGQLYRDRPWARWLGEQISLTNVYRLASGYGTSYERAFGALVALLLVCGVVFSVIGLRSSPETVKRTERDKTVLRQAQHERKIFNDFHTRPVRPELVEG